MDFTIVGGVPNPRFNIEFTGSPPVSHEDIVKHEDQNRQLGLPEINTSPAKIEPHGRRLAVIGGGPSINDNVEKIRAWDGDRWSIGGAYHWCLKRDIESTFVACDPHHIVAQWAAKVTKAIVTSRCHPSVFDVLRSNNAEVKVFDLGGDKKIITGSSTATAVPHMSALEGYRHVTFFGCESSYIPEHTHAYMNEKRAEEMIVQCGGKDYYTAPDFLMQAMELAVVIKIAPHAYFEESGGLLRAMLEAEGEYKIRWVSDGLLQCLKPKEAQDVSDKSAAA
jgi:hypothetical protein